MSKTVFSGVMPALMTPCGADRQPNFDALVAKATELTGLGMSAVIYAGSMGDWPLLTDEQRMEGVHRLVTAGIKVIVGTGAQNPMRAAAIAAHAKKVGAAGLMIIPRVLSRGASLAAQNEHFAGILEAAVDLPSVIYNSPYYGFQTKADLFMALHARYPHLVGFKEFGSAAAMSYAAEHIINRSDKLALMIGVDTEVFHGYVNCGASGAITGIGNALPREVLHLARLCVAAQQGDPKARRQALELDAAFKVLSAFDEGGDLVLYYKYIMTLEGTPGYEQHFNASDALVEGQKTFAREQLSLFKRWYAAWTAEGNAA